MKTLIALLLSGCSLLGATYYVAPSGGLDSNPGTSYGAPLATFTVAVGKLSAGDTLILKNGSYSNQQLYVAFKNGTALNPINIQAETEGSVFLQGLTTSYTVFSAQVLIRRSSYIYVTGLHTRQTKGYGYKFQGTTYCQFIRCVAEEPNPAANVSCFTASWDITPLPGAWDGDPTGHYPAMNNLFVDCIVFDFWRHGVAFSNGAWNNVVRGLVADSLGGTSAGGGYAQEIVTSYGGSSNIVENCIALQSDYVGFSNNGIYYGGKANRFLGCVVLGSKLGGFLINARGISEWGFITNTVVENCVALDRNVRGGPRTTGGMIMWHGEDNYFTNCFSQSRASDAFLVTQSQYYWDPDSAYGAKRYPQLRTWPFTHYLNNCVTVGSKVGFGFRWDSRDIPPVPPATTSSYDEPYQGTHTSYSTNNTADASLTASYELEAAHHVLYQSGFSTANPGYNTTKYGEGAYLMRAPNQPTRGASVIYAYEDGVLTTTPLWPHKLEAKFYGLTGKSITWAATNGIWKTLDGVYAEAPAVLTVAISIVDSGTIFEGGDTSTVRISRYLDGEPTTSGNLASTMTISGTAVNGTHYNTLNTNWQIDTGFAYEDVVVTTTPEDGSYDGDLTIILTLDADAQYTITTPSVTLTRIDTTFNADIPRDPALPGSAKFVRPL